MKKAITVDTLLHVSSERAKELINEYMPKRNKNSHPALQIIRAITMYRHSGIFNDKREYGRRYKLTITARSEPGTNLETVDKLNQIFDKLGIQAAAYLNPVKSDYWRSNWYKTVCIKAFDNQEYQYAIGSKHAESQM